MAIATRYPPAAVSGDPGATGAAKLPLTAMGDVGRGEVAEPNRPAEHEQDAVDRFWQRLRQHHRDTLSERKRKIAIRLTMAPRAPIRIPQPLFKPLLLPA